MRNDIIKLITTYADGADIKTESVDVFAEKKSITRSEFYASFQVGLTPKCVFVIDSLDYEQTRKIVNGVETYAQQIQYNDATFNVIRSYETGSNVELTVG